MSSSRRLPLSLGHGLEQLVTGGVAEGVVDRLEVVEVHEQDAGGVRLVPSGEGMADAVHKQRAVGRVVSGPEGLVLELVLEGTALGDRDS